MNKISSEEIIKTHLNPIKNLDLPSTKILIPTKTSEEIENTTESLQILKKYLRQNRVERKNSRSEAIWLPEKHLSKFTRRIGKIQSTFGFTENSETYLTPEESLYLLETNYLELFWNGVPFSIEQAYSVLLQKREDLEKYRAFRNLVVLGYRIQNPENTTKRECGTSIEENDNKKIKTDNDDSLEAELFEKLKEEGPKTATINDNYSTMYNLYLPKNSIKSALPDFEIINKPEGKDFSSSCGSGRNSSTVTTLSGIESVSFYQFHEVDLENK